MWYLDSEAIGFQPSIPSKVFVLPFFGEAYEFVLPMTLGEMMLRFGCAADIFSYPALEASMRDETVRPLPLDVCPWPAPRGRRDPASGRHYS